MGECVHRLHTFKPTSTPTHSHSLPIYITHANFGKVEINASACVCLFQILVPYIAGNIVIVVVVFSNYTFIAKYTHCPQNLDPPLAYVQHSVLVLIANQNLSLPIPTFNKTFEHKLFSTMCYRHVAIDFYQPTDDEVRTATRTSVCDGEQRR